MNARLVIVLAILFGVRDVGHAQHLPRADSASGPPGYRAAITAGVEEYEAKNYLEAREQFRHAHELYPNARTLRALGLVEYDLRNYPDAVRYLEQALASRERPLDGEMRMESETWLERARAYVGELRLKLEPTGTTVLLDGHPVDVHPAEQLLLPIGDHVVEFQAAGYAPERRSVAIQGRHKQTMSIELVALSLGAPHIAGQPLGNEHERDRRELYKRWWPWTILGVGAVAGGIAAAVLMTRHTETRERPFTTENTPVGYGNGLRLPEFAR